MDAAGSKPPESGTSTWRNCNGYTHLAKRVIYVKQYHNIVAAFDKTFCSLDHHLGNTFVIFRKFIKCRIDNFYLFSFDRFFYIGLLLPGAHQSKGSADAYPGSSVVIALATCFSSVVLPVFGWDTIIPRCPLPIGAIRSSILIETPELLVSKWILSLGKIGVRSSNLLRCAKYVIGRSLTFVIYKRALNFSFCVRTRRFPSIISPVRSPKRRKNAGDT